MAPAVPLSTVEFADFEILESPEFQESGAFPGTPGFAQHRRDAALEPHSWAVLRTESASDVPLTVT